MSDEKNNISSIIFANNFYHLITPSHNKLLGKTLDLYSDQNFSWGEACIVEKERIDPYSILEILEPFTWQLMKEMGVSLELQLTDVWRNTYYKGSFQEPHDHPFCALSAVIFLDDCNPEDGGRFYFKDRHQYELGPWAQLFNVDIHYVQYKKGDILFFPSYMVHGVTPYKSKSKTRQTISINYSLGRTALFSGSIFEELLNK